MLPEWLTIVIAVVGLLGTVLGVLGISGYIGERAKHKAEIRNRQEDRDIEERQAAADQRLRDTFRGVFQEEISPINKKLDTITTEITEIKQDLADNTIGTVTLLRDRMKAILDECRSAGYASASTKANWHELYNTYASLGGNHFREYVDAWKQELEDLPSNAPSQASKIRRMPRATIDILTAKAPIDNAGVELKEVITAGAKKGGKK